MKLIYKVLIICLLALNAVGCIKDEPLNAECDIIAVTLPGNVLNREPLIDNNKVVLIVKNDVSLLSLAPEFELTPGATIDPASGTALNFVFPQTYTVTSQDGKWSKRYTVEVQRNNMIRLDYNFEHVKQESALLGTYDVFYETGASENDTTLVWASANRAFAMTMQASTPNTFPTYQGDGGVNGKCAVLVTRSTGRFGAGAGKPIAAGNLFIGNFKYEIATSKPLQATQFGTPFYNIPSTFSGYYKYTPGETYCEADANGKLVPVPGKSDMFNLYAVFFESVPGMEFLDGSNVLSADNPNIIATAEIPDRHASEEWVNFTVPFKFREGKTIDMDKLTAGRYSITVVMSSSQDGDYFCGAIGSTLSVDELLITCLTDK